MIISTKSVCAKSEWVRKWWLVYLVAKLRDSNTKVDESCPSHPYKHDHHSIQTSTYPKPELSTVELHSG